jgi:hypothetical protein
VQDLLDQALYSGGSFSSRHRFYDTAGDEHSVIVVADRMRDETGTVEGTSGYYIDVTEAPDESRRDVLNETLPKVIEARAENEQAKGSLKLVYGINDEQAFNLLRWRSQENHTCGFIASAVARRNKRRVRGFFLPGFFCGFHGGHDPA